MIKARNNKKNTSVKVPATPVQPPSPNNKRLSPSDPPIRLLDKGNRLIAGIKLELAIFSDDTLRLNGWCLGSAQLSLLCDGIEVSANITRHPRLDVLDANSTTSDFDPGFELVLTNAPRGTYSLRWHLTINGETNLVDFPLELDQPDSTESSSSTGKNTKSIQAASATEKSPEGKIDCHIEYALPIGDGLALIGWVDDRLINIPKIYISFPDGINKVYPFVDNSKQVKLTRTLRLDAASIADNDNSSLLGFVAWLPIEVKSATNITLAFDEDLVSKQSVLINQMDGDNDSLAALQIHSGFALRTIAEQLNDTSITARLDDIDADLFAQHGRGQIAAIDQALTLSNKAILINGWIAADLDDIQQIDVVAGGDSINIKSRLVRTVRLDLFEAFPWSKSHSLGFIALIDDPALLGFSTMKLRVRSRTSGQQVIPFTTSAADWPVLLSYMNAHYDVAEPIAKLILASPAMQSLPNFNARMASLLRANFMARYQSLPTAVDNPSTTLAAIDRVFALGDAGMLIFGWHYEPKSKPLTITIRGPEGQSCDVTESLFPLLRLDVRVNCKKRFPGIKDMCGFVCFAPIPTQAGEPRAMQFNFKEQGDVWLKLPSAATEAHGIQLIKEVLATIPGLERSESESVVHYIAEHLKDNTIVSLYEDIQAESPARHLGGKIAEIDQILSLNNKAILINGWIAADLDDILQIEVVAGGVSVDIKSRLVRTVRPDLLDTFPWLKSNSLGFLALIDNPALLGFSTLKLRVQTRNADRQLIRFKPVIADWPVLLSYMNAHYDVAEPIAKLILASPAMQSLPNFNARMASLLRANFIARYKSLPTAVDNPSTTLIAIDRIFALGDAGMLIFGWHYEPKAKPVTITVRGPEGQTCDITGSLFPLARIDVSENFKNRFPDITDLCGFACFAPIPTQAGEPRAMQLSFKEQGEVWIKLPSTATEAHGIQLIKEILGFIPAPDRIRGSLYALFNRTLGSAIEAISASSRKTVAEVSERQFGTPPIAPSVSVIIPLYGRYDFMRHQLAHFVDDTDFDNADLIYVIDDPAIIVPALDMAARYHQLFNKPFRVVWYGQNLGFAGANNIGVRVARADTLLLLNSDVIPQANGWLTALHTALNELPCAGAVGPLLQFADNSVQHAGMLPKRDPFYPGFLLNIHPGKGINWNKSNEPSQHPLLTAACLMLRKADFLAEGGFDEGYIIGDFEDSDLCLKLRKRGQTLWLVPAARLWHLERQSQNLENIAGYRQLLTLFNGWRYHQKIINGEIANPEQSGA